MYAPLTTFCDAYEPATTVVLASLTTTKTTTVTRTATSTNLTASATPQGSASTTSSALAVSNLGGGLVVWIANVLAFFFSIVLL